MPGPLLAIAAPLIGSLLGGLFKNKGKKPATSTNTSTNTATSTPTLSPAYQGLQDAILPMVTKRLSSPTGLPPGYLENGLQAINETHDAVKMGLDNDLTSRGLGTSPVAGNVMGTFARGRATDISKFRNSLPGLEREYQNDDLAQALSVMNFGKGNTMSSTGNSTGTATGEAEGAFSSGMGDLSSMLGWLIGSGAFGAKGKGAGAGGLDLSKFMPGGGTGFRGFGF